MLKPILSSIGITVFLLSCPIVHANGPIECKEAASILVSSDNLGAKRLKALKKLTNLQCEQAPQKIIEVLKNDDFPYYFDAISLLSSIGENEVLEFLNEELARMKSIKGHGVLREDEINNVGKIIYLSCALFKRGDSQNIDYVYGMSNSEEKIIRSYVVNALSMVDTPESRHILKKSYSNDLDLVVCGAAKSLVELGDEDVKEDIRSQVELGKAPECFYELIGGY